jgi:disulfide bond formation protein DsbB
MVTTRTMMLRQSYMRRSMIVLAIAVITLAAAYGSQYFGGLAPCELCLYQRWPWWAAIALLLMSLLPAIAPTGRGLLITLAGIGILAGAGVAFYHVGVEQHWWPGPAACSGGQVPDSFADLQKMMNTSVPRCDEPAWSLFGISMAGYNGLLSLAVGIFAIHAGLLALRDGHGGPNHG